MQLYCFLYYFKICRQRIRQRFAAVAENLFEFAQRSELTEAAAVELARIHKKICLVAVRDGGILHCQGQKFVHVRAILAYIRAGAAHKNLVKMQLLYHLLRHRTDAHAVMRQICTWN